MSSPAMRMKLFYEQRRRADEDFEKRRVAEEAKEKAATFKKVHRDIRDYPSRKIINERLIEADSKDGKARREGVGEGIIDKIFEHVNKGGKRKNRRKSRKNRKTNRKVFKKNKSRKQRKSRKH